MADTKISALPTATAVTDDDYALIVNDPGGTPATQKITVANFKSSIFNGAVLSVPQINDTSSDHQYIFAVNELVADRTVTLPLLTGNDTFVFESHTQTLANKTLTTPVLGVATATSINKVAITAPATSATLTIADGKTASFSNTLAFTGTDGSTVACGAGGTVAYIGAANAWADNVRQTFNPGADAAGINVGAIAGDPGTPVNGDLWYDSTANEMTARINGANVALGAGGGTPGGSDTQLQRNNAGAFGGISGATTDGTTVTFASANMIATRPKIITSLDDTNGNEVFKITATASAVNEITIANAATGSGPVISATGGDINISITLTPKGTGQVLNPIGTAALPGMAFTGATSFGISHQVSGGWVVLSAAGAICGLTNSGAFGIRMAANYLTWAAGSDPTAAAVMGIALDNSNSALQIMNGTAGTYRDLKVRQHYVDQTITAGGTTGNQTINKAAGTVNIAAAGTTVTVTCSLCTTSSTVHCVIRTNDSTARIANVVPGAGSFVINLTAAATAEISIGFLVVN